MKSRVEELCIHTRNHPAYQHLVTLESVFSYPVPLRREERTYLRFLIYRESISPVDRPAEVYRPYARASVEFPSGKPVEYTDLYFSEGAPDGPTAEPVGTSANPAVEDLTFDQFAAKRSALFGAVGAVIPLIGRTELTTDEREAVMRYRELFETLVEPGLRPYYRKLNPRFFSWTQAVVADRAA